MLEKTRRMLDGLPNSVYIMLKAALRLSVLALLGAFFLLCLFEEGTAAGLSLYMTAMALVEAPPGLMLVGLVLCALLHDRS